MARASKPFLPGPLQVQADAQGKYVQGFDPEGIDAFTVPVFRVEIGKTGGFVFGPDHIELPLEFLAYRKACDLREVPIEPGKDGIFWSLEFAEKLEAFRIEYG